jgi:D-arabinose 1-dehydrogenase-like Zn-dependent alcohol dehydrogenase
MKALQYRAIGAPPEVVEIETPEPGPGRVQVKITAAGVCHSDAFVMGLTEEHYIYGLPLTFGHERAGVVDKLGEGVHGVKLGDSVAVYVSWAVAAATCAPRARRTTARTPPPRASPLAPWRSPCSWTPAATSCRWEI